MVMKVNLNKKAMINIDLNVNNDDLYKYLKEIDEAEAYLAAARNKLFNLSSLNIRLENKKSSENQ